MTTEELLDKIMQGEIVTVQGKTLLTGSQWYDRFIDRYLSIEGKPAYTTAQVMEAAKKAAGL